MNKPLIVANWKMGVPLDQTLKVLAVLIDRTTAQQRAHAVICPSFLALALARSSYSGIMIGAQDCASSDGPALTGNVSANDLRELGCSHVIVGHSERRVGCGETDAIVAQKVQQAVRVGLRPILCVGESLKERRAGQTTRVIRRQLERSLALVMGVDPLKILIAYEPLWAVGAKEPASVEAIREAHDAVHQWMTQWSDHRSVEAHLLYGGAVDASNIRQILKIPFVDGVLVGRSTWSGVSFARILKHAIV